MSRFQDVIGPLLRREGGYVWHPADRGGPTNHGVTKRVYDAWLKAHGFTAKDVADMTRAEAEAIYHERYWMQARCEELKHEIRDLHFDAAVNHGVTTAARLLQFAAGVKRDGVIGPMTLQAVHDQPITILKPRHLVARYRLYGHIIQRDRTQTVFAAGWLARLEEFPI